MCPLYGWTIFHQQKPSGAKQVYSFIKGQLHVWCTECFHIPTLVLFSNKLGKYLKISLSLCRFMKRRPSETKGLTQGHPVPVLCPQVRTHSSLYPTPMPFQSFYNKIAFHWRQEKKGNLQPLANYNSSWSRNRSTPTLRLFAHNTQADTTKNKISPAQTLSKQVRSNHCSLWDGSLPTAASALLFQS